jgi:hypothetical protein
MLLSHPSDKFLGVDKLKQYSESMEWTIEDIDFAKYKSAIKKSEDGNRERLKKIIANKQIFCIPWLLCY